MKSLATQSVGHIPVALTSPGAGRNGESQAPPQTFRIRMYISVRSSDDCGLCVYEN